MSDRESLRPVIADILDGLAIAQGYPFANGKTACRLYDGAETLRWAHAFEETPTGAEVTELERLRELVGEIGSVIYERPERGSKASHPGTVLTKVTNLLEAAEW